ncbi:glycosyltransferase family 4 protein [Pleurocapsa sp. PCC 7319]|uniref:glycosyltransferase family 4 protein n=1 Tax=Pleurocapsa sp. PCC 7319 TaxID=118161 RepID=UPI0003821E7F|nr:glycosyltransferase family 4 protein [Pleurocapsa sp. PCC 7319]
MSIKSKLWSKTTRKTFVKAFQKKRPTKDLIAKNFNLLIITQFFPPDYAATGQLIQELANQLGQKNIQVNIFTGQPGYAYKQKKAPAKEIRNNVAIQRSRASRFWSQRIRGKTLNGIVFALRSACYLFKNAHKNDLVILTTAPPFLAIIGFLAKCFLGINYICLVYDLYPEVAVELGVISQNNLVTKLWNKINTIVWNKSKKVVVLSETMKQRIIAKNLFVPSKISVIHNWADAEWIKPLKKQKNWFARQYGINHKFTVLYSGNFGLCHDLDTVLGAMKILKNQPVQFVFIGAGAKHDICRQRVLEFNLKNSIFLPYQDRDKLPYSLTACDLALVSIAPGLEGIIVPSKVYGIMAAGKAIAAICESHSYLRKLITDAECGAYFNNNCSEDLAKFILTLASNPELTARMGISGRNYMQKNFTPQIIAQKYCEILDIDSSFNVIDNKLERKKVSQDKFLPTRYIKQRYTNI